MVKLSTPKEVVGSSNEQVLRYATRAVVGDILIHHDGDVTTGCTLNILYGTEENGEFVPLDIDERDNLEEHLIPGDIWQSMAQAPISPSEREKNPYQIVHDRIIAYLVGQGIIEV